jgi:NADPH:quinone reductase-like Zn-dependent oxidoreductase
MDGSMRVVEYDRYGGPEVLAVRTRPVPEPGPRQVLLRVLASGLNPKDDVVRSGLFRRFSGTRFPKSTGFDLAGDVVAVGADVEGFAAGQRVWGLLDGFDGGAAADYAVVDAAWIAPAPHGMDPVEAAGLPLVGLTALQALRAVEVRPGQSVLVKGASGGVGSAAIQLATEAGARVTAVAGPDSQEHCRELGAVAVHDYTRTDPAELPERFDVVLDCIGGSPLRRYRRVLARGGRLVSIAPSPSTLALSVLTRILPGPSVRTLFVKPRRADLDELRARVEAGALRMPVQETFPLERVADAHRAMAERHGRGKRVLLVGAAAQRSGDLGTAEPHDAAAPRPGDTATAAQPDSSVTAAQPDDRAAHPRPDRAA